MSRLDAQSRFVPSLLDRLTDPVHDTTADRRRGYSLTDMIEAVRRDLEDLLNTRQTNDEVDPGLTRAHHSILGYGLPEMTALTALTPDLRDTMAHQLEEAVSRYEPRLRDVRVIILDNEGGDARAVRCRIEARLAVDPAPEVTFDSLLEVTTGHHTIARKDT